MYADYLLNQNRCLQCNLDFDSPHELQNHKRRFCLNSGYDNLEGLAKKQWQGTEPSQKPAFSHKNHLQAYGSTSLTKVGDYRDLNSDNLERDMKNIDRFKRQLQGVRKYKHQPASSHASSVKTKMQASRLTKNSYSESRLDEDLKKYDKPLKESTVVPDFIDQLNMKNHTVLDKSNSSLGRMPIKDQIQYAKVKIDQLTQIKQLYVQNGGNRPQFKNNIQKMLSFYNKFLKQQQEKYNKKDEDYFNSSQLIQSRVSTPILKLRNFEEKNKGSNISTESRRVKTSKAEEMGSGLRQKANNISTLPGVPGVYSLGNNGYPAPFMIPYPYPQPNNDTSSLKVLQRMIELKSEENLKLLQIMLEDRKRTNNSSLPMQSFPKKESVVQDPSHSKIVQSKASSKRGFIDVEQNYQFKKSMIEDLISQEKVLLSLQQQELDQLKLLSQLPQELQEIKLQTVIKSSETRHQVEKELLKQKLKRLAYQEQNQTFEEDRKLNNDRWAGEERKKLLQQQMGRYLDNFEQQLLEQ